MISDPKTTPDTRLGRILFAGLVALGAWVCAVRLVLGECTAVVAGSASP